MKTTSTCFALLALIVSISCTVPPLENSNSLSEEKMNALSNRMVPPQDPASTVWTKKYLRVPPEVPNFPFYPTCLASGNGYFRDPYNCVKFYYCSGRSAVPQSFYCDQSGFIFDTETNECTSSDLIVC